MSYWGVVPTYRLMRQPFRDIDDPLTMYGHPHHELLQAYQPSQDFKVAAHLHGFTPEEISVKISDRTLCVEARHESESEQGGRVSRSYKQEYVVPVGIDLGGLKSSLNADGTLTITAPKREAAERAIPIEVVPGGQSGDAAKGEKKAEADAGKKAEKPAPKK